MSKRKFRHKEKLALRKVLNQIAKEEYKNEQKAETRRQIEIQNW